MNSNEQFRPGDHARHKDRGLCIVVQDDGGPTVGVRLLTPDAWENTDMIEIARSSLVKVYEKKKNKLNLG